MTSRGSRARHGRMAAIIACAAIASFASAGSAHAAGGGEGGWIGASMTPFQLAFGPPGLQVFKKEARVYGLRLSLLYGDQSKVGGLDLGLFSDAYDAAGLQAGLGNQVFGKLRGVQLGVANSSEKGSGVQIGLLNRTHHMKGLQIGLLNWNDEGVLPFLPFVNWHF